MKKIVSLLLALVMVLSLGVAAFAVDADETPEEPTPTVTVDEILAWVKDTILPEINLDLMKEVIKQTKATIDSIVEILKPIFTDDTNPGVSGSLAELPAAAMNAFIDLLAKALKTDRETIINKLLEIPLIKKIMGWYGYKPATTTEAPTVAPETTEAPAETKVPDTGAAAAVAAVASLSVAAAAAFVSKKKAA